MMKLTMQGTIRRMSVPAAAAAAVFFFTCRPAPAAEQPANALMVVPSGTAFDRKFQDYLDKNGAKLLQSHPPSVFVGHIPPELDKRLEEKFGARVYRGRVDDWASFARYGEQAIFAVNAWNKRFLEDPPEAPLVVSARVGKTGHEGEGIKLVWNSVMKAVYYRLQISRDPDFASTVVETHISENRYTLYPAFFGDGVYYWRVAGMLTLNTGEVREGAYSETYNFAVSRPRASGDKPASPAIGESLRVNRGLLAWPGYCGAEYYRMQLSAAKDFEAPLADVFTDTCSYRMSGLPVEDGRRYYTRIMGAGPGGTGNWSMPAEVLPEAPVNRKRRKR